MISEYLYGAYGSNLDFDQMARRCPDAVPMGSVTLPDYQLMFRGVADIDPVKGASVPIGLWRITEECEQALDYYEGFPHLYQKIFVRIPGRGLVMLYAMPGAGTVKPPCMSYLSGISQGYRDFSLNRDILLHAVEHAWANEGL